MKINIAIARKIITANGCFCNAEIAVLNLKRANKKGFEVSLKGCDTGWCKVSTDDFYRTMDCPVEAVEGLKL